MKNSLLSYQGYGEGDEFSAAPEGSARLLLLQPVRVCSKGMADDQIKDLLSPLPVLLLVPFFNRSVKLTQSLSGIVFLVHCFCFHSRL